MQECPGRRVGKSKLRRRTFRKPPVPKPARCRSKQRRCPMAGSGKNGYRHQGHDLLPAFPAMQVRQVVGAHEPDKANAGKPLCHSAEAVACALCRKPHFQVRDPDARMSHDSPCPRHALRQWGGPAFLQRIARRHQPPHLVEGKSLQGFPGDMRMTLMGRIKRPAKQPDAHSRPRQWESSFHETRVMSCRHAIVQRISKRESLRILLRNSSGRAIRDRLGSPFERN